MNAREIREQIGRVKPYYLRNEILRAVTALLTALKGLGNTPPGTDLRGPIREAVQLISRDQQLKSILPAPLSYQPGQEKVLRAQLQTVQTCLQAALNYEDHDKALERKVQLDQAYNRGLQHLSQNRVSEADAEFAQALSFYKDEHRIFLMIAEALLTAGEVRRAYPYAKQGAEVQPQDSEAQALFLEVSRQRTALKNPPE